MYSSPYVLQIAISKTLLMLCGIKCELGFKAVCFFFFFDKLLKELPHQFLPVLKITHSCGLSKLVCIWRLSDIVVNHPC